MHNDNYTHLLMLVFKLTRFASLIFVSKKLNFSRCIINYYYIEMEVYFDINIYDLLLSCSVLSMPGCLFLFLFLFILRIYMFEIKLKSFTVAYDTACTHFLLPNELTILGSCKMKY